MNHIVSLREAILSLYLTAKCCNGYDTVTFPLVQLPGDSQTGQKSVDYFGRQPSGSITYGTFQGNLHSAAFNILLISPSSFDNQPKLDTKQPQLATHDWAPAASTNFREIFFPDSEKLRIGFTLILMWFCISHKNKRGTCFRPCKSSLQANSKSEGNIENKMAEEVMAFKFGYVVECVTDNRSFSWVLVVTLKTAPWSIPDQ